MAEAALLWTGRGYFAWPRRDDAAVIRRFGEEQGNQLLAALKELKHEFYESEAHLTEPNLTAMATTAAGDFRKKHPGVEEEVIQALTWCYTYDWK